MEFNYKFWSWNNGKYYQSYPTFWGNTEIRWFSTKEAEKSCGELWIDNVLIKTGEDLGFNNYHDGTIGLLKFALENNLCKN